MADLKYRGPDESGDGFAPAPGVPANPNDPTLAPGQDPASFAGIPFSYSTGAGGSVPPGGASDPTAPPGIYPASDTLAGTPLGGTGAPGSGGAPAGQIQQPGVTIQVTDPNAVYGRPGGGTGNYVVSAVVGPDSTAPAGTYPPARPIIEGGFYPASDGAGQGNIMIGGWKKGVR
jgi:hypothetical protein